MTRYRADWLVPIAGPPVRGGWVDIDHGRVVATGSGEQAGGRAHALGSVAILPGLVNAHTHLELSHLRNRVSPAPTFVTCIRQVVSIRRQFPDASSAEILSGIADGIAESIRCGTAIVGDISNTLVTFEPLARSPLVGVLFYELIRFNAEDPSALVEGAAQQLRALRPSDQIRTTLAAHAPYSVAPSVFEAIRRVVDRDPAARCSVHLSESAEEVDFIRQGGGAWQAFLEDVGVWDPAWVPPGVSPVAFLDESGFLDDRVLAIHGVQMTDADLQRLAARGSTLVACPRSNLRTGAGTPPLEAFYASGVRVAVGTDSLASTPDLNIFSELAAMRALAPSVPAARFLNSATREGARALGFGDEYGTIEPGKRARLIAVNVPAGIGDVEEYLVSGVRPEHIAWIGGDADRHP